MTDTGTPSDKLRIVRDAHIHAERDNVWSKPNPMPESTTDRCTSAHEYVFQLTKSARYYFDHEAIKEPAVPQQRTGKLGGHSGLSDIALAATGKRKGEF